ncbi:hypothetical protein, partial [Klebsiella pneumoniae]|uniref:hypothetical protein n=1 Tax=Klebsiella pneumoniae TaxID=573 RepID=UPI00403AB7F4
YAGLVFYPASPRAVTSNVAGALTSRAAGQIAMVGLFVDADDAGVLGIFRPKTTKCSGGPAVCGLQRGITFFEIPIWALFE